MAFIELALVLFVIIAVPWFTILLMIGITKRTKEGAKAWDAFVAEIKDFFDISPPRSK